MYSERFRTKSASDEHDERISNLKALALKIHSQSAILGEDPTLEAIADALDIIIEDIM